MSPKTYAKENIIYNKKCYDNSTSYFMEYYKGNRVKMLISNLKEYKRIKRHSKEENYLYDLIK